MRRKKKIISHSELLEFLDYNPDTGVFLWNKDVGINIRKGASAGCNSKGYHVIMIKGVLYSGHSLAWYYCYKKYPNSYIKHKNGDTLDNRISNLYKGRIKANKTKQQQKPTKEMNANKNEKLNIDRELIIKRYIMASDEEKMLLEQLFGDKVKPVDIQDKIQTFEDILEYNGVKEIDFNTACIGLEPDEIAYKQLKLIAKAYNSFESENNKTKEKAFVVYATSTNGSKNINLSICEFGVEVLSRIGFINMDHASDATKKFRDIYKTFSLDN